MLDGFWMLDIVDQNGLRAYGMLVLRGGAVAGDGDAIDIAGTFEEYEDAILATLTVVLRGTTPEGEPAAERVHLHVQGRAIGDFISASGIDRSDVGRRVDICLERWSATHQRHVSLSSDASPPTERKQVQDTAEPTATENARGRSWRTCRTCVVLP